MKRKLAVAVAVALTVVAVIYFGFFSGNTAKRPQNPGASGEPTGPVFTAEISGRTHSLRNGAATLRSGVLTVYLSTAPMKCKHVGNVRHGARIDFVVPAGPDSTFFAGSSIQVNVGAKWRDLSSSKGKLHLYHATREDVVLRMKHVAKRIRGELQIMKSKDRSFSGQGTFDVENCEAEELTKLKAAPQHALDVPLVGKVDGKPFRYEKAFFHQVANSLVLTNNARATCKLLFTRDCSSPEDAQLKEAVRSGRVSGTMLELRTFTHRATNSEGPAWGALWTPTHDTASSTATLVDGKFALRITRNDAKEGGRLVGTLRGWDNEYPDKVLDVAGSFDAEICSRTCR